MPIDCQTEINSVITEIQPYKIEWQGILSQKTLLNDLVLKPTASLKYSLFSPEIH